MYEFEFSTYRCYESPARLGWSARKNLARTRVDGQHHQTSYPDSYANQERCTVIIFSKLEAVRLHESDLSPVRYSKCFASGYFLTSERPSCTLIHALPDNCAGDSQCICLVIQRLTVFKGVLRIGGKEGYADGSVRNEVRSKPRSCASAFGTALTCALSLLSQLSAFSCNKGRKEELDHTSSEVLHTTDAPRLPATSTNSESKGPVEVACNGSQPTYSQQISARERHI
jgi:hypothetical protein